jgi:hypothetical protein
MARDYFSFHRYPRHLELAGFKLSCRIINDGKTVHRAPEGRCTGLHPCKPDVVTDELKE